MGPTRRGADSARVSINTDALREIMPAKIRAYQADYVRSIGPLTRVHPRRRTSTADRSAVVISALCCT
jgi:hypothetical protein